MVRPSRRVHQGPGRGLSKARKLPPGIRQLEPSLWEVNVSAGVDPARTGRAGKPVYRRVYKRVHGTLTDAKNARQALAVESRQGRYGGTDATVDDLLDAWLRELERIGRAPKTITSYKSYADKHVRPIFGRMKVRQVTARMLADHLAALSESKLKPNTVRLVHACLSSAFSQAARWEWVDKDPTKLVRAPSLTNKRPKVPTVAEVAGLLKAAEESKTPEMARAIWLASTTGVRRGELCALRVSDFDLERGRMQVERAISDDTVWTTKNRRWREVALDPLTIEVVRAQVALLVTRATDAGAVLVPDAYLFSDHAAGLLPWKPGRVTMFMGVYMRKRGFDTTFHQLRKFMESQALGAGFKVTDVAAVGGHDPSVLLRYYAGAADESQKALVAAVANLLQPKGQ